MLKQQQTKRRNTENLRELFHMQNIQENTTQTCCRITHSQNIPRDSSNGPKVLSWENIINLDHCTPLSASTIILDKNQMP